MLTSRERQAAYRDLPAVYRFILREISSRVFDGLPGGLRVKVSTSVNGFWNRGIRQRMVHFRMLYDGGGQCFAVGTVARVTASDPFTATRNRRLTKLTATGLTFIDPDPMS